MRALLTALTVTSALTAPAAAQTKVAFWHAFSGQNGTAVDTMAEAFNASQEDYVLAPVYTGKYTEGTQKLQAAIAGGTAPGLVMLEITRYELSPRAARWSRLPPTWPRLPGSRTVSVPSRSMPLNI